MLVLRFLQKMKKNLATALYFLTLFIIARLVLTQCWCPGDLVRAQEISVSHLHISHTPTGTASPTHPHPPHQTIHLQFSTPTPKLSISEIPSLPSPPHPTHTNPNKALLQKQNYWSTKASNARNESSHARLRRFIHAAALVFSSTLRSGPGDIFFPEPHTSAGCSLTSAIGAAASQADQTSDKATQRGTASAAASPSLWSIAPTRFSRL